MRYELALQPPPSSGAQGKDRLEEEMRSLVLHLQQLTRDLPDVAARYNLSRAATVTEGKGAVGAAGGEEGGKGESRQEHGDKEVLVPTQRQAAREAGNATTEQHQETPHS